MAKPRLTPDEETRAQRILNKALSARVTLGITLLAVLGAVASLATHVATAPTLGALLGFIGLLLLLAQIAGRSFQMQLQQQGLVLESKEATETLQRELQIIRHNTEQELRAEEKQTKQLEQLLMAMREFKVIQVESLDALRDARPTTSFYLQRHAATIIKILGGHWDRHEHLRPEQLWREYGALMARMRQGETFRSTVCIPSDPSLLFEDVEFSSYAKAIEEAARSQKVRVKRLFVLKCEEWPPSGKSLDLKVHEHLSKLAELEAKIPMLEARVTSEREAVKQFHMAPPDFMMWDEGLLILSDLDGPDGLVTRAEFYFASDSQNAQIVKRLGQFDEIFSDPERSMSAADLVASEADVRT